MRLDKHLKESNMVSSRTKAQELIIQGKVLVNNDIVTKNKYEVKEGDVIVLTGAIEFVSRSGNKLKQALREFDISVKDLVCLDVGASTGGFTDCLIQNEAKKVYAVDVGNGQIAPKLQANKKVSVHEDTDIRDFLQDVKINFDVICVDVSFVSLRHILPSLQSRFLKDLILLYKPQFEVGRGNLNQGVVKKSGITEKSIDEFKTFVRSLDLKILKMVKTELKGKYGNQEFLIHLKRS